MTVISATSPATQRMSDHTVGEGDLASRATANTLVQLFPPLLRVALGIGLLALLSRELGQDGLGQYALIFAYVSLFNVVFNDWGLSTIVLREISRHPDDRIAVLRAAASLQVLVSGLSYALMIGGLFVLDYAEAVRYGVTIYGLSLLFGPVAMLALPFQADLRLRELLAPSITQTALTFALSVGVLAAGGGVVWLAAAGLAATVVQYAWTALLCRPWISRPSPEDVGARKALWRTLAREAWPIGLASTLKVGWQQLPVLVLGAYSVGATGVFHAANRVPQQILVLPMALNTTMFPLLTRSWAFDRTLFARQLDRLIAGSMIFVIPATVFGIATAAPFVRLLLGPDFDGAGTPYALLLAAAAMLFPIIFLAESLNAASCQRLNLILLALLTPAVTIAVILGARHTGVTGVAAALVGGYAAYLAALAGAALWRFGRAAPLQALGAAAASALAGGIAVVATSAASSAISATAGAAASLVAFAAIRPDLAALAGRTLTTLPIFATRPMPQEATHGQRTS
jgi:O-antigen/teichoic acid export membrane protein